MNVTRCIDDPRARWQFNPDEIAAYCEELRIDHPLQIEATPQPWTDSFGVTFGTPDYFTAGSQTFFTLADFRIEIDARLGPVSANRVLYHELSHAEDRCEIVRPQDPWEIEERVRASRMDRHANNGMARGVSQSERKAQQAEERRYERNLIIPRITPPSSPYPHRQLDTQKEVHRVLDGNGWA